MFVEVSLQLRPVGTDGANPGPAVLVQKKKDKLFYFARLVQCFRKYCHKSQ